MTAHHRVLLIGFDPRAVPGVDASMVETAIAMGEARLQDAGFATVYCLFAPDDLDIDARVVDALRSQPADCVVVGGGIRKPDEHLVLFERIVNLIRVHAPSAAIAFNATGADSVDAVLRWLDPGRA